MGKNPLRVTIAEVFNEMALALETGTLKPKIRVGLTVLGSEHGPEELVRGAESAQKQNPTIQVVIIGGDVQTELETVPALDEKEAHATMDKMLSDHALDAAVTMHYNFPIGVATVGRVVTPALGQEMFLTTTTGISATDRISAMLKNTVYGLAVAKACAMANPTVGILNIEGARQVERALQKLKASGYSIDFAESARTDGGVIMRGNDLLMGIPDIMVNDSLSGNVFMKVLSAFTTGGSYESVGKGYGPGVGENFDRIICIVSRASGAPVIAGAINFAADCAKGDLLEKVKAEFSAARIAGWDELIKSLSGSVWPIKNEGEREAAPPPRKTVTDAIPGVEVMQLEDAVQVLWQANIYAESGMGCTGPIVMIAPEDKEKALALLKEKEYL